MASIRDFRNGSIVHFANSVYEYMKVENELTGEVGVVRLLDGKYFTIETVNFIGLNPNGAEFTADNLNDLYFFEEED